jgi:hypothetical protein
MFTQSCSNVKALRIAFARISLDLTIEQTADGCETKRPKETTTMLRKILSFVRSAAHNENSQLPCGAPSGTVSPENVRALATGAALAVALDASPAVLVSIYDYARRVRDYEARRMAC